MPNDAAVLAPGLDVLEEHCRRVRLEVIRLAAIAKVGHYGPSLSAVELLVSLYYGLLSVRPDDPEWSARDRFVLSKGHACSALYPILVDLGFFDASILDTFTRLGSRLGDHPDRRKVPGVDFSSGSLGHGPSIAAGMAEGLRAQGIDSRVVAIVGDGEQHEGQVWEAAGYAGFRRLSNLLVICDRNGVCVDGRVEDVLSVEPMADRWRAFGWHVEQVDGHDLGTLLRTWSAYDERRRQPDAKPTFVIADTISGRGIDFIEDDANWHLGLLAGQDEEDAVTQVQEATTWARA